MAGFLSSCEVFFEDGFIYAILALGFYISYTILDFPDLSVEGTVLLGGVSFALLTRAGINPWVTMIITFILGGLAGCCTGLLHVKLHIKSLLCGILVSTALISVNLVASVIGMGGDISGEGLSTISIGRNSPTIFRDLPFNFIPYVYEGINIRKLCVVFIVAIVVKILMDLYLKTKNGMLLKATGCNSQFTVMLAKDPGNSKITGLALANGLASLSGSLIAQSRGNANQSMGLGMVIIGLASVIIGLSVFSRVKFMKDTTKVILGAVIYQACLGIATMIGIPSAYNKFIMAALFTVALVFSNFNDKNRKVAEIR